MNITSNRSTLALMKFENTSIFCLLEVRDYAVFNFSYIPIFYFDVLQEFAEAGMLKLWFEGQWRI